MRILRHSILLFTSIMALLSGCKQSHPQERAVVAEVAVHDQKDESSIPSQNLMVKPIEAPLAIENAPLLDVSVDNAFPHTGGGSSSRGPSMPYVIPGGSGSGGGKHGPSMSELNFHMLAHWNEMAIDASGRDHNLPSGPTTLAVREQMGPGRSSRALAIVHIAMFEAINAIEGGYESYVDLPQVIEETNVQAAIAVSAYDTLAAMFPSQDSLFLYQKALDLQTIPASDAKERGIALGHQAAEAILALRADDGSAHAEPVVGIDFIPSDDPGKWRKDPISNIPLALGGNWSTVAPFVMTSAEQFRAPAPPAVTSAEYTAAYNEVKDLGGDGTNTPTNRTAEQTEIAIFWAYDGLPALCAPPRLFNQIAMQLAEEHGLGMLETARMLALINVAMADAAIAIWESKYFYQFWRPVTGIREADVGTGPSMLGDGNPLTLGDVNFSPLGAPASNSNGPNFTPPFPAYPSGHAGFGGAIFQIFRKIFGTDEIEFTFVSDELNGVTKDNQGNVRPLRPRTFTSFSQAEEENGQSRIYLGIHWVFDKTGGITQGNHIADYVWDHLYKPVN